MTLTEKFIDNSTQIFPDEHEYTKKYQEFGRTTLHMTLTSPNDYTDK